MPRIKSKNDREVLAGALKVIIAQGPTRFSLHHVSKEVGLAPATLLQRFGSKEDLLVQAIALANAELRVTLEAAIARVEAEKGSAIQAIITLLVGFVEFVTKPEDVANGLDILKIDMLDPAMNAVSRECFDIRRAALIRLLQRAQQDGELSAKKDVTQLAAMLEAVWQGAIMFWGIYKDGSLTEILRKHFTVLLGVENKTL